MTLTPKEIIAGSTIEILTFATPPTIIHFPGALHASWRKSLPNEWKRDYPDIFDDDDLRLARSRPHHHFCEWLSAIHIFHRDGALSLVEKYGYTQSERKVGVLNEHFPHLVPFLRGFRKRFGVQPPDLFIYQPGSPAFRFAEVKGPGDHLRKEQVASHTAITKEWGAPVEIIEVREQ